MSIINAWDHDHPEGSGWIRTVSGRYVNLIDPKPEQIVIGDIAHALGRICRFGGHVATFCSVAEHSLNVANMVLRQCGEGRVVLAALLHDATEAYLGDMVRPLKQAMPEYRAIESRMAGAINLALGLQPVSAEATMLIKAADEWALVTEMATIRDDRARVTMTPAEATQAFLVAWEQRQIRSAGPPKGWQP